MTEERTHAKELANQIWNIANKLRGNIDSVRFKDYILGFLFYKFLSQQTENALLPQIPEHCSWKFMIDCIKQENFSIQTLETALYDIQASAIGTPWEDLLYGIFDTIDLWSQDLGKTEQDRVQLISEIFLYLDGISITSGDDLGTIYMILLGLFASDSGKKGGQFFTSPQLAKLVAKLAVIDTPVIRSACDCCAGSGSLLMSLAKETQVNAFFGSEIEKNTYNMLCMNFILHNVTYKRFVGVCADTLKTDPFYFQKDGKRLPIKFHVQVANPPFSLRWHPDSMEEDPRFKGHALAGASAADLAFVQHIVYHMANDGKAVVILPVNALSRSGNDRNIRKELLPYIDAVITVPQNLFLTTGYQCCVVVLKRQPSDTIFFVDASEDYIQRRGYRELSDEAIARILHAYTEKSSKTDYCTLVSKPACVQEKWNLVPKRYITQSAKQIDIGGQMKSAQKNRIAFSKYWENFSKSFKSFAQEKNITADYVPIGDLVTVNYGKSYEQKDYGEIPVLSSSGCIGYTDKSLVNEECVIIGRKGTLDHPLYSSKPCWVIDTAYYCLPKTDIDMKWLYYAFCNIPWNDYNDAGGVPSLSADTVREMEIAVPPLPVQHQLSEILSSYDLAVQEKEKELEALKTIQKGFIQKFW